MKPVITAPKIIEQAETVEPEIYFDEAEETPEELAEASLTLTQRSAPEFLNALEQLFELVRDRRDWRILLLRSRGRSYRSIASELEIGTATVERFVHRAQKQNRELGLLLRYSDFICRINRKKRNKQGNK
ncbi:MAG: hypothetical protein HPZ91_16710 [Lentisphaeria bacterium]|nr:hypothetical protein [Lentisphaeria bacterium]